MDDTHALTLLMAGALCYQFLQILRKLSAIHSQKGKDQIPHAHTLYVPVQGDVTIVTGHMTYFECTRDHHVSSYHGARVIFLLLRDTLWK